MDDVIVKQIEELIEHGQELSNKGLNLQNDEVIRWYSTCKSVIISLFGKGDEERGFRKAKFPEGHLMHLKILASKVSTPKGTRSPSTIVNVSQTTMIQNEITFNIFLNIDHSDLSDKEKEEAKELVEEVKEEIQKKEPNWKKVIGLLKKSFDYGLKIAPEVVKLADAYYRAKGLK